MYSGHGIVAGLMVCVHSYAPNAKKLWSQLGLAFAIVYAAMACVNYIVQLTIVRLSILNKETDGSYLRCENRQHKSWCERFSTTPPTDSSSLTRKKGHER